MAETFRGAAPKSWTPTTPGESSSIGHWSANQQSGGWNTAVTPCLVWSPTCQQQAVDKRSTSQETAPRSQFVTWAVSHHKLPLKPFGRRGVAAVAARTLAVLSPTVKGRPLVLKLLLPARAAHASDVADLLWGATVAFGTPNVKAQLHQ